MNVRISVAFAAAAALIAVAHPLAAQDWIAPTPAELSMTSIPEVPGAAAVYLNRELVYNDIDHERKVYARIKILTDAGKENADVEVAYYGGSGGFFGDSGYHVDQIAGRTIHSDGTIVPFTGKPYERLLEKAGGYKVKSKVFTLPTIEVGSIIEYRYRIRYEGDSVFPPKWYLATDLYTVSGHFVWRPFLGGVSTGACAGGRAFKVAWSSALPKGVTVDSTKTAEHPHASSSNIEVSFHDILPVKSEEFMPPVQSLGFRVLFYYTSVDSIAAYWKQAGVCWSAGLDAYIGPGQAVKDAVKTMILPGDSAEKKLRTLYDSIMQMENTDYTRQLTEHEQKAKGLNPIQNTDDVLHERRGTSRQLNSLFIAMARAAGFKAYEMAIADRRERIFQDDFLSMDQLDDYIAIVEVDGKDQLFDPGTRYCNYGHLYWPHALSRGLRQVADGATALASTPGGSPQASHEGRAASFTLDETGQMEGTAQFSYTGDSALYWHQRALLGDETSLERELREDVEDLFPPGTEVKVTKVENQTAYERPFLVNYQIKGDLASHAGKRFIIPADLFEATAKPRFTLETREYAVDIHHAVYRQDAILIKFPPSFRLEAAPDEDNMVLPTQAGYRFSSQKSASSITLRRDLVIAAVFFSPAQYPALHGLFNHIQTKDQESVVSPASSLPPRRRHPSE